MRVTTENPKKWAAISVVFCFFIRKIGVAGRVLGSVNLLWEMTSAFGIECNFFFSG